MCYPLPSSEAPKVSSVLHTHHEGGPIAEAREFSTGLGAVQVIKRMFMFKN